MALAVQAQWAVGENGSRATLRCCFTHETPANDASTCSGSLHSHQEQVVDRIADQFHQWAGIDT